MYASFIYAYASLLSEKSIICFEMLSFWTKWHSQTSSTWTRHNYSSYLINKPASPEECNKQRSSELWDALPLISISFIPRPASPDTGGSQTHSRRGKESSAQREHSFMAVKKDSSPFIHWNPVTYAPCSRQRIVRLSLWKLKVWLAHKKIKAIVRVTSLSVFFFHWLLFVCQSVSISQFQK